MYEFLMGLNSEFSVIRTQILATKPTPSLGTAYHLVAEDEQQIRAASFNKKTTQEAAAFQAFVPAKREGQQQKKGAQRTNKGALDNKTEHFHLLWERWAQPGRVFQTNRIP